MKSKSNKKILCSDCFKALGVPSRAAIFSFLRRNGKSTVGEVVKEIGLTQPTISYHLKEMKLSGLLRSERRGKEVYYEIGVSCPYSNNECVLSKVKIPVENAKD